MEDGKLVIQGGPDISAALTPLYADAFQAGDEFLVRFTRNGNGKLSGLTLGFDRVRSLRFERR